MTPVLNYDKFASAESRRWDSILATAHGQSDEHYKNQILECDKADEQLRALQSNLAALNAKSDASVARHGEQTGPLQAELANPETTMERRIELRAAVNAANAKLKTEQDEIAALTVATKDEIDIARSIAGRRVSIENAWWKRDPADQERIRTLEKVIEAVNPASHHWQDKASESATAVADEKARRAKDGRSKYDLADLERTARMTAAVASRIRKVIFDAQGEIEELRRERLAELYQ